MSVTKYVVGITAVIVAAGAVSLFWKPSQLDVRAPVQPNPVAKEVSGTNVVQKKPPLEQTPTRAKSLARETKALSDLAVTEAVRQWIDLATSPDFLGARLNAPGGLGSASSL